MRAKTLERRATIKNNIDLVKLQSLVSKQKTMKKNITTKLSDIKRLEHVKKDWTDFSDLAQIEEDPYVDVLACKNKFKNRKGSFGKSAK